jgi:hypothetical protein
MVSPPSHLPPEHPALFPPGDQHFPLPQHDGDGNIDAFHDSLLERGKQP